MLGYFPKAYPDELIYSVLSRAYVGNGFITYREFAQEVQDNKGASPSVEFLGFLKPEILEQLKSSYEVGNIDELIMKGTQYPYYTRFYTPERKKQALDALIKGESIIDLIRLTTQKEERYIRYCPKCVLDDRSNYGETYWHRSHQMKGVNCCHKHGIRLVSSGLILSGKASPNFHTAEIALQDLEEDIEPAMEKEMMLAQCNKELLDAVIDMEGITTPLVVINNALYDSDLISKRGGAYRLARIEESMADFYRDCPEERFTKSQISKFFAGKRIQPIDYARMALFLGIDIKQLLSPSTQNFCIAEFDQRCRLLLQQGVGVNEAARQLGVTSGTVRDIRDGKLQTEKITQRGKGGCTPKNWDAIDTQYLPLVIDFVASIKAKEDSGERPVKITAYLVAKELGLPNKAFPRLKNCTDYISQFEESREEYWAREIVWAYHHINDTGDKMQYASFRKLLNVRRSYMVAALPFIKDDSIRMTVGNISEK